MATNTAVVSLPWYRTLSREQWGVHLTGALADGAGISVGDACRRRGIAGLLQRRPVVVCVGAQMSWMYSQVVPHGGGSETRQTDRGDGYDLWHALLASAADVFLTGDRNLADNLGRLRIEGFRVVTSLRDLLELARPR